MQIEAAALRFLADEEFVSTFEFDEFVRINGGTPEMGPRLRTEWIAKGWLESIPQSSEIPDLLRLTDRAFGEHASILGAT